jgi:hypothetical protein
MILEMHLHVKDMELTTKDFFKCFVEYKLTEDILNQVKYVMGRGKEKIDNEGWSNKYRRWNKTKKALTVTQIPTMQHLKLERKIEFAKAVDRKS